MAKRMLTRDKKRAMVGGVVAGVARYFDQDVNLFRIITVAVVIFSGVLPGVIVYAFAMLILQAASDDDKGDRSADYEY